jgi:hypothetical protein
MKEIDDYLKPHILKFVTDNYNGLYEIYTTKINQEEMTFDEFCIKMFYHSTFQK